jgi:hypothetical protein
MATVPELLERVASAPDGSGVAAFFEYDGDRHRSLYRDSHGLAWRRT